MKKKSLNATKKNLKSSLKILNNQKILKIYKSFKNSLFLEKKFAVAVSGGPDSMSLAFLSKCFAIKNNLDVYQLGIFESSKEHIKIVEWPELIDIKPKDRIDILLKHSKSINSRKVEVVGFGKWKNYNFNEI